MKTPTCSRWTTAPHRRGDRARLRPEPPRGARGASRRARSRPRPRAPPPSAAPATASSSGASSASRSPGARAARRRVGVGRRGERSPDRGGASAPAGLASLGSVRPARRRPPRNRAAGPPALWSPAAGEDRGREGAGLRRARCRGGGCERTRRSARTCASSFASRGLVRGASGPSRGLSGWRMRTNSTKWSHLCEFVRLAASCERGERAVARVVGVADANELDEVLALVRVRSPRGVL